MKKNKGTSKVLTVTTVFALVFSVIAGVYLYLQLYEMENGVLDVCATQQDAYVQLVLDQINLKQNRENEEIITDILGTLDASTNKYWTFSCEESMIFVKDVLETNKYKGFTTATYYASDSAQSFLQGLNLNKVTHANITIQEKDYIASGVAFEYGGAEYRLCLLTNRAVLLDNNKFLGAKIEFTTLAAVILMVFIIAVMSMAWKLQKVQEELQESQEMVNELGFRLTRMDEQLMGKALHDRYQDLWLKEALPEFVSKLKEREAFPVVLAHIVCTSTDAMRDFLDRAKDMLDKNVVRFRVNRKDLLLIFIRDTQENAKWNLVPLLSEGTVLGKCMTIEDKQQLSLENISSYLEIGEIEINESENIS